MKLIPCFLILSACGSPAKPSSPTPPALSQQMQTEISRIIQNEIWQDDVPSPEPNNDLGDFQAHGCLANLLSPIPGVLALIPQSISSSGQPFRSPEWMILSQHPSDSYSRDQLYGLIMCTLSGLDKSYLQSVYNYYNSTGLLCPNATDSKCVVTPELDILVKDTLHLPVSDIYRQEGEAQLDLDLQTSPQGYAQTLLADAIFIKIHQGLLTTHHQNLIRGLLEKSPNNLYYQLIGLLANNGDWPSFEQRVLTCLKKTNGGGNQWMFDSAEDCLQPAYGQDIVSLAQWVINSGVIK